MPEVHMPDMKAKLQDMNESIKQAKMPNPQEIKDGYLNSNFHKSFHQQLAVRTRVEGEDLQQIREHMTKNKTPAELVSRMPPPKNMHPVCSKYELLALAPFTWSEFWSF